MFIRIFLFCTALFIFIGCTTAPDIIKSYNTDSGPWLTLHDDPATTITINWLTAETGETAVYFGTDRESLEELHCYTPPSKLHSFRLTSLEPHTTYYYSLDGNRIYSFSTLPENYEKLKIIVIGDLQPFKRDSRRQNELMADTFSELEADLYLQLGDVTENGGMNFLWKETLANITRYGSTAPFIASSGNHDYYMGGQSNFRMLFPYDYPSDTELYHSVDMGNVKMIFLDYHSENPEISLEQLRWLEEELHEATSGGDWIFLFFHGTLVSSGRGIFDQNAHEKLIPLIDRFDVDALFFGHSHLYEHWQYSYGQGGLIYNSDHKPSDNMIHYFLTGGGGATLRHDLVVERPDINSETNWIDRNSGNEIKITATSRGWSEERYINNNDSSAITAPSRRHYYHLPEEESYWGLNSILGFQYGEMTLHYISIELSGGDEEACTISVHFPDGDLMTGPEGRFPQKWVLKR